MNHQNSNTEGSAPGMRTGTKAGIGVSATLFFLLVSYEFIVFVLTEPHVWNDNLALTFLATMCLFTAVSAPPGVLISMWTAEGSVVERVLLSVATVVLCGIVGFIAFWFYFVTHMAP